MSMDTSDLSIMDPDASARRMAAERAACHGVDTDRLERLSVRDLIAAATEAEAKLRSHFEQCHREGNSLDAAFFGRLADMLAAALRGGGS